ncbi:MAG: hypothetical protein JWQ30_1329, partial [Sediminibacterium sp.]|nr:hypothetical protein [Sediminibacterium sp.]
MPIRPIIFLLCIFSCVSCLAQTTDSIVTRYKMENIVRYSNGFMKRNEKMSFTDLRNEFASSVPGSDL